MSINSSWNYYFYPAHTSPKPMRTTLFSEFWPNLRTYVHTSLCLITSALINFFNIFFYISSVCYLNYLMIAFIFWGVVWLGMAQLGMVFNGRWIISKSKIDFRKFGVALFISDSLFSISLTSHSTATVRPYYVCTIWIWLLVRYPYHTSNYICTGFC